MIPEIDTPTFPLRTFMKELKNQGLLARARWKNCKNILASANEIQANLPLITKIFHIQEMLDCIVFSSIDVRVIRRQMFLPLYISFLINVTSARVLTEGVILDQKEGILESSIPEQPFVKCLQAIPRSRPPSPPPVFPVYSLIRFPRTAALYYLNAWNRLLVDRTTALVLVGLSAR